MDAMTSSSTCGGTRPLGGSSFRKSRLPSPASSCSSSLFLFSPFPSSPSLSPPAPPSVSRGSAVTLSLFSASSAISSVSFGLRPLEVSGSPAATAASPSWTASCSSWRAGDGLSFITPASFGGSAADSCGGEGNKHSGLHGTRTPATNLLNPIGRAAFRGGAAPSCGASPAAPPSSSGSSLSSSVPPVTHRIWGMVGSSILSLSSASASRASSRTPMLSTFCTFIRSSANGALLAWISSMPPSASPSAPKPAIPSSWCIWSGIPMAPGWPAAEGCISICWSCGRPGSESPRPPPPPPGGAASALELRGGTRETTEELGGGKELICVVEVARRGEETARSLGSDALSTVVAVAAAGTMAAVSPPAAAPPGGAEDIRLLLLVLQAEHPRRDDDHAVVRVAGQRDLHVLRLLAVVADEHGPLALREAQAGRVLLVGQDHVPRGGRQARRQGEVVLQGAQQGGGAHAEGVAAGEGRTGGGAPEERGQGEASGLGGGEDGGGGDGLQGEGGEGQGDGGSAGVEEGVADGERLRAERRDLRRERL
ncbi:hypothetical protein EYF80_016240 [Liparis tanakae]|uniref:Uncharacterized protein n=1 Tax=Liparis tanakae TaxID=230148 RepID=A0A4Z2I8B2_9TELE|nr:hypothetical protein EYF80_016240 [Liparis tanakae]